MNDAALYYEGESRGLGVRFLDEIERCIAAIAKNPNAGAKVRARVRRRLIRKFPIRNSLLGEGRRHSNPRDHEPEAQTNVLGASILKRLPKTLQPTSGASAVAAFRELAHAPLPVER